MRGRWRELQKVRLCSADEVFEISRILETWCRHEAHHAVGKAGIKIEDAAVGNVRGDSDAECPLGPKHALSQTHIIVLVRVGLDPATGSSNVAGLDH